jgi:hypothetical protein
MTDRSPHALAIKKSHRRLEADAQGEYLQTKASRSIQPPRLSILYKSQMESTASCSLATFPANSPTSSPVRPSASKKKAQVMRVHGAFKCKLCARAFPTARARGSHQKAHRQQQVPQDKKKKANKAGRSVWPPASIWPCSFVTALRSACLRAQPFSDWSSHYNPSVRPVPASFPWQTGTGVEILGLFI